MLETAALLDSALLWSLTLVLLTGRVGLGFVGVAAHHGHVGLLLGTALGWVALACRRVVIWRLRHRDEPPSFWTTLKHLLFGGGRVSLEALVIPLLGYYWAHAASLLPNTLRPVLGLLLAALLVGGLYRAGFTPRDFDTWPSKERRGEALHWLRQRGRIHLAWLALTLVWVPPTGDVTALLARHVRTPSDVHSFQWVDEPFAGARTSFVNARGLMLLSDASELSDVHLVHIALSHDGVPVRVVSSYDLSETSAVAEAQLTVWQKWAAWVVVHGSAVRSIEIADLRGEADSAMAAWSRTSRIQRAITNRQQTGQWRGIGRASIELTQAPAELTFALEDGVLRTALADRALELDLGRVPSAEALGANLVYRATPPPKPGALVPWAVDRLRAVSWIGSDGMQWLKGWVFRASEQLEELQQEVVGIDPDEVIAEQLGDVLGSLPLAQAGELPGWPPQPVVPSLRRPMAGEGRWVSLAEDFLAPGSTGDGSPFVFTFIRTDPERDYIQTSVTLWDPRRVELHVVAGTEEPKSVTGEQGSGTIPRSPALLGRVVAAFNGAFQAVHGQFGMVEDRRVQLPPKPYAATVLTFDDGQAGFGTWPLAQVIAPEVVGLRQNLTPLVQDGQINPYRRTWWGGVPEGWTQETRTVRSGLCLTQEGYMAYFYSPGITPDGLAKSMISVRCSYGIHLDMNAGHTGFEFYRVGALAELPDFDRRLDPLWEARGSVEGVSDLKFLSRLMVRKMPLMNFPRYINTTSRDFFFLTRRELLPGPPVPGLRGLPPGGAAGDESAAWRVLEVGGTDWPHAGAVARVRALNERDEPERYLVVRLDPKQLQWVGDGAIAELGLEFPSAVHGREGASGARGQPAKVEPAAGRGQQVLWLSQRKFVIAEQAPSRLAQRIAIGSAARPEEAPRSVACVDGVGMLLLVHTDDPKRSSKVPDELLQRLGCASQLYFTERTRVLVAEGLAGARERPRVSWFVRAPMAGAQRVLTDTPVLPPEDWAYVQQRAVPYDARANPKP